MEKNIGYKIKLGLFVIMGLIIFIIGIYMIGKQQNMFSRNFRLNTQFKQVNGLQPGNNVRFSGINVGTVEEITIENDSTILVNMIIQESVKKFIKRNAIASIGSDGLMGNMLINISPADTHTITVEDGDYLQSFEKVNTQDIINTLNSSNENLALLIEELLVIAQDVNEGKGTVGVLMKDKLMATDLKTTIKNISKTTEMAVDVLGDMQVQIDKWKGGEGLVNALLMDTSYVSKLNTTFENLEATSEQLHGITMQLRSLVKEEKDNNTVNTVLRDSTFNANLQQTMVEIKEGTEKFNENMKAMRENWLFKKYFKNQEKSKE